MLRCGGFLLFTFLASGVLAAAQSAADGPRVDDQAGFFSKPAVEQARQKVQEIQSRFKVEVVIETVASIPADLKDQYEADQEGFFRNWVVTRANDEGAKGIYVLLCKDPGQLQIALHASVRTRAFRVYQRDALAKKTLRLLEQKQYDAALAQIVDSIASTVQSNLGRPAGGAVSPAQTTPDDAQPDEPQQPWYLSGWICFAAGMVFVVWLAMAVFRPFFDGGIPSSIAGGGGSGPVYRAGGGGFFSSLLGGLFGAAAGTWMADSFSRGGNRGAPAGDTSSPQGGLASPDPDPLSADQAGGGGFDRDTDAAAGGDFGGDDATGDGNGGMDNGGGGDFDAGG